MYNLCDFQEKLNELGLNDFIVKNVYKDKHNHKWVELNNKNFDINITWDSIINTKGKGLWFKYRLSEQGLLEYCKKFRDYNKIKSIEFLNIELKKRCSVLITSYDNDKIKMTLKNLLERYDGDYIFLSKKYMLNSDFVKKLADIFDNSYNLKLIEVEDNGKVNNRKIKFMCDGREFEWKFINCYRGMEKDIMKKYWTATSINNHLKSKFCINNIKAIKVFKKQNCLFVLLENINDGKQKEVLLNNVIERGYGFNIKSQPEEIIACILDELNVEYIREAKFEDLIYKQHLKFDFYLLYHNTCIEFDGGQHIYPIKMWGGQEGLLKRIERDKLKDVYCKNNNIILKRIPYWKNIYDLLKPIIQDIVSSN